MIIDETSLRLIVLTCGGKIVIVNLRTGDRTIHQALSEKQSKDNCINNGSALAYLLNKNGMGTIAVACKQKTSKSEQKKPQYNTNLILVFAIDQDNKLTLNEQGSLKVSLKEGRNYGQSKEKIRF